MKFKKCYLHIGTEKTGTTALQQFLEVNSDQLQQEGFYLPKCFSGLNRRKLSTFAMDDDRMDDGRKKFKVTNIHEHRSQIINDFAEEISCIERSVLLLSSEHCHSRLSTPGEVQRLYNFLKKFCEDITVIVYLRPQHEMATSLYSTALRVGLFDTPILPMTEFPIAYYNYHLLLTIWSKIFGDAVMPRLYNLLKSDICADFIQIIGVNSTNLKHVKKQNTALDMVSQLFLKNMNKSLNKFGVEPQSPFRGDLASIVQKIESDETTGLMPSREEVEEFMCIYAEGNEHVRKAWFPEHDTLFDIDSGYLDETPLRSITVDEAFDMFAQIWCLKQRQVRNLLNKTI